MRDLEGQIFSNWTVLKRSAKTDKRGWAKYWDCVCSCGNLRSVNQSNLVRGLSKSCGCWGRVKLLERNSKFDHLETEFNSQKAQAQKRGLEWSLTLQEFKEFVSSHCVYCDDPPTLCAKGTIRNGIDRINPSIGYHLTNSVSSCSTCNYMKQSLSLFDFMKQVHKIYHKRAK